MHPCIFCTRDQTAVELVAEAQDIFLTQEPNDWEYLTYNIDVPELRFILILNGLSHEIQLKSFAG